MRGIIADAPPARQSRAPVFLRNAENPRFFACKCARNIVNIAPVRATKGPSGRHRAGNIERKHHTMAPKKEIKTKAQIVAAVAEKAEISKKQAATALDALVAIAYAGAKGKNGIMLPGLGKLILVNRKARMGRNPATGAQIKIPAKKVVKFRVAKAAKDAILAK